jgi:hypothetical protein
MRVPSRRVVVAFPPQRVGRTGTVERDPTYLTRPWRGEARFDVAADGCTDRIEEVEHAGLDPGPDVEYALAVVVDCGEERIDDVAYEDVIAGLSAVAVDGRLVVVRSLVAEDCHHARLAVRVLAWPVDVAEPQCDVGATVESVEQREILFGTVL